MNGVERIYACSKVNNRIGRTVAPVNRYVVRVERSGIADVAAQTGRLTDCDNRRIRRDIAQNGRGVVDCYNG